MAKTIFFVDDEPDTLKVVRDVLEGAGFKVITAGSGKEALAVLRKNPHVDLALLDYFMPEMNGLELCEKIRADPKIRNVKCAILSVAKSGEVDRRRRKELNIIDFIPKLDITEFVRRVKKLVGE